MSTAKAGIFDDSDDEEFVPKATTEAPATTAEVSEAIPNMESEITKVEEAKTDPSTAAQLFDDDDKEEEYVPQG